MLREDRTSGKSVFMPSSSGSGRASGSISSTRRSISFESSSGRFGSFCSFANINYFHSYSGIFKIQCNICLKNKKPNEHHKYCIDCERFVPMM